MRPELEKIKYIEDYLLGNLNNQEKADFEKQMEQDPGFAAEVEHTRLILSRVKSISYRKEIQAAHRRHLSKSQFFPRNSWFIGGSLVVVVVLILSSIFFNPFKDRNRNASPFVNPPVPEANKPYQVNQVKGDEGAVLAYTSGTKIFIPPNAFLDAEGNIIKGKVELSFREFNDPFDFYLAGIPMDVTLNGQNYTMESAAMCDIRATFKGEPVKVNPDSPISVFQKSYTTSTAFDRFFLDTINKQWVNKGKDNPINLNELVQKNDDEAVFYYAGEGDTVAILEEMEQIVKPIRPKEADPYKYSFDINFDVDEFPEMKGFKNVAFEIDEDEKRYNPSDSEIEWEDVLVVKGRKPGTYKVTFTKKTTNQSVEYVARPVFEGKDYKDAVKLYDQKLAAYKNRRSARKSWERKKKEYAKRENRRIDSINRAIEKRSKLVLEQNRITDSINRVTDSINKSIVAYDRAKAKVREKSRDINFKRTEIIYHQLVPKDQIEHLSKLRANELVQIEDWINNVFDEHAEYIDLFNKHIMLLNSALISAKDKKLLNLRGRKEILEAKELILDRFGIILNARQAARMRTAVVREFGIDGFGIWNVDDIQQPTLGDQRMKALYLDKQSKRKLKQINLVDESRNAIIRLKTSGAESFVFNRNNKSLLWDITDDRRLVYFNDFKDVPETKEFTFEMSTLDIEPEKFGSYAELKETLQGLME